MNVDYQVLTFKNQIKPKDIGGLGVELNDRKGSGNYDKERTKFNIEYVGFAESDWKEHNFQNNYEKIALILVDFKYLLDCYYKKEKAEIEICLLKK